MAILSMPKLVIIPSEKISAWIKKGEVAPRYYNPGGVFSEVHLLLPEGDEPPLDQLQRMAGDAEVHVHHYPSGKRTFLKTMAWSPFLLKKWAMALVPVIRTIRPDVIRCHGAHLNSFAASVFKRELGIPYLVSMHINPDEDIHGRAVSWKERLVNSRIRAVEKIGLRNADLVLPVYEPILPFLRRLGVERYEVAYNFLNIDSLVTKTDYRLHKPVKVISVGRQFAAKNPDQLIRAIARLENTELYMVGDGTHHQHLKDVVSECGIESRVKFFPAISNDQVCRMLPECDVFATHTEYWEISKSVLEPLLTGLPVILNRRSGEPVPELQDGLCMFVENTVTGYYDALKSLVEDSEKREALGRAARAKSQSLWSPEITESRYAEIYRRFLKSNQP